MPGLIGVSEFVDETKEDYNSPTTSSFVAKMPQCRQTISVLEDVSDAHFLVCLLCLLCGRNECSSFNCVACTPQIGVHPSFVTM